MRICIGNLLKILCLIGLYCSQAYAYAPSDPGDLQETLLASDTIVVARLVEHKPSASSINKELTSGMNAETGGMVFEEVKGTNQLVEKSTPIPQGMYTFEILKNLKGQCDPRINIPLSLVGSMDYGYVLARVEVGDTVLLMLKQPAANILEPTDKVVPLVWLEHDLPKNKVRDTSVDVAVADFIANSLANPLFRRANSYLLRTVVDAGLVNLLRPYADDANRYTRGNILQSLAANQQVDSISKIVQLQNQIFPGGQGTSAVASLGRFTVPAARPMLNRLLLDRDEFVRLNSLIALRRMADKSSIPYLILALRDPDRQRVVRYWAYLTLHRLIPKLGKIANEEDFYSEGANKVEPIEKWWNAELRGEHVIKNADQEEKTFIIKVPEDREQSIAYLQANLFVPSSEARKQVLSGLDPLADSNSVPYLLLATGDPDLDIAYKAYLVLYRVIKLQGKPADKEKFNSQRGIVLNPLYKWWTQELSGGQLVQTKPKH